MSSNSDADSDIEIIELNKAEEKVETDDEIIILPPKSNITSNAQNKNPQKNVTNSKHPNHLKVLSDDERNNNDLPGRTSTPVEKFQIPIAAFHCERTNKSVKKEAPAQSPVKRKRRGAAQNAIVNIKKNLCDESIFDFDINPDGYGEQMAAKKRRAAAPSTRKKGTKKSESPLKYPTLSIQKRKVGETKEPRRLWSNDQNELSEISDSPKIKKTKTNDNICIVELTPSTFKSSIYKDPAKQLNRMLANASKINEDVKNQTFHPNVSYSYRSFSKNISKHDSHHSNQSNRVSAIHFPFPF